ncbi:sirohydrochlorin chelatase [Tomitella biformata]|uniref:sirohydrochlorin chelatase n=1 Tax=Tomitella biformata TaxID=630403 RepID=UPI000467BB42|nr:sirohydrochlorin chelatase [Tomitella biformata]
MNTAVPLIAVAHGSRDPRSAQVIATVVADVRAANPGLDVRLAFLDLSLPAVADVIAAVAAEGHHEAIVVPLLLGDAFHSRVDLPGILAAARRRHPGLALTQSDVLGSGPELLAALHSRISEAGAGPGDGAVGVVLAAVGSARAESNAAVAALARRATVGTAWVGAEAAFATGAAGSVATAMARLRARGARTLVVAPWFLAPGLLLDRVCTQAVALDAAVVLADPLGASTELSRVILDRYRCAHIPLAASA